MKKKDIKIGDKSSITKVFTSNDVEIFSKISLDSNPIHLDENYAVTTQFCQRIVHGFLVSGLISAVLGTKLPGKGTIYLAQSLQFKKPVYIGNKITANVEITKIREDKPIINLRTYCVNQDNEIVIDGEAIVKI